MTSERMTEDRLGEIEGWADEFGIPVPNSALGIIAEATAEVRALWAERDALRANSEWLEQEAGELWLIYFRSLNPEPNE